jgi:cytochrome c oxidase accessory protein FixG
LPTLNQDGSRRRIRPKLYDGEIYRRRRQLAYGLLLTFVALPFIHVGGRPVVLLDVAERRFTLFGGTFLATDGVLLMLALLGIFVGVLLLTALLGRAFCGWGCPQTVYMEFVFRPIERLFEGDRNSQLRLDRKGGGSRRALKNVVFLLLAIAVANVFLAYFVGVKTLSIWMTSAPSAHPVGFAVMGVTSALVFFDFAYFREQMCTVVCPYARLQAALIDRDSLIIGYQLGRGEPRHKGKSRAGDGDCVDCSACVVACPTGIDIRDGLQLECIACGQCIDACNTIMPKVGKPLDLIRYASQSTLLGGARRILRPRVAAYSALVLLLLSALIVSGTTRQAVDVTVLRGIGAPFTFAGESVQNQLRVKLEDHTGEAAGHHIQVLVASPSGPVALETVGARAIMPENPLELPAFGHKTTTLFVLSPRSVFQAGTLPIIVRVTPEAGESQDVPYRLLGPEN